MKQDSTYYSEGIPKILDIKQREKIGRQILGVLKVHLSETKVLSCLDIGCSSGVITNLLATEFNEVYGIDIDEPAINFAKEKFQKENLKFIKMDNERFKFKDGSFDVVVCNQVYNFVNDQENLINEIYRVLKKGGVCFFSARNKYQLIEPQYNLLFLSWLPLTIANIYLKVFNKGPNFFGYKYLTYNQLLSLVKIFTLHDYTLKILKEPDKYGFRNLKKFSLISRFLPAKIISVMPNFIWILEKK